jgi:hypothetical protein
MFGAPEAAAHLVTIYMGSLDDPSIRAPTYAQFTRDRVSCASVPFDDRVNQRASVGDLSRTRTLCRVD